MQRPMTSVQRIGKVTVSTTWPSTFEVTEKTARNRLKEHGGFVIDDSEVRKKT